MATPCAAIDDDDDDDDDDDRLIPNSFREENIFILAWRMLRKS